MRTRPVGSYIEGDLIHHTSCTLRIAPIMIILLRVLWVWIFLSLSYAAAEPQCWGAHHADPSWFGFPDYYDCRRLLFGNNDLSGIAAIDDLSHAFVVPETRREFESDSEWESKVELPKFWRNCQEPLPRNRNTRRS